MCDTVIALGNITADGVSLFAKNSDREPNEPQALTFLPRATFPPGATVQCTYAAIPQTRETYAVLLSRPVWLWGGEMGLNEHGVAIGNEAVFTKEPYAKTGLLGMDLLRLALERAATAREALDVIVQLLEQHGQGGSGGFTHAFYYHNAFLIADPHEAWGLETADRHWAAFQVHDFYTLSNGLTIGQQWDLASPELAEHAVQQRWCRSKADFHFGRCYSDPLYTRWGRCADRQARSAALLRDQVGQLTVTTLLAFLRDHGPEATADPAWDPAQGSNRQLCMHASWGPIRGNQTTASLVVQLDPALVTVWTTGTSAPCTGLFKPLWPEAGLPDLGPEPARTYDGTSLWWQHERLHRAVLEDYPARLALYRAERDALETEFVTGATQLVAAVRDLPPARRQARLATFSAECWQRARAAEARWTEQVLAAPGRPHWPSPHHLAWQKFNRAAQL